MARQGNTKSFWDQKDYRMSSGAASPADLTSVSPATRVWLKPLLPTLAGRTVLELGCGYGYLTPLLAPACKRLVGLDFSENAIEAARRRCGAIPDVSFRVGDILNHDLEGPFDAIVGRFFLHEIGYEDTPRLLQQLDSLLAENGFLYFHENSFFNPVARFIRRRMIGRFGIPKCGSDNEVPFDRSRFRIYHGHFKHCERYVDGVELFQKAHQYLLPARSRRLAGVSSRLDQGLTSIQMRTGLFNNWSYTQTVYASHSNPRSAVLGATGPPRTEGAPPRPQAS